MNKIIQLGNLRKDSKNFTNPQTGRAYSKDGIAPTINTCQGETVNRRFCLKRLLKTIKIQLKHERTVLK